MPRGIKKMPPTRKKTVEKALQYLKELLETEETIGNNEFVDEATTIALKLVYQLWVCELLRMEVELAVIAKQVGVDRASVGHWRDADYKATFEHSDKLYKFYSKVRREKALNKRSKC